LDDKEICTMAPTTLNRVVLLMSALILAVGVIDGIVSREWDFVAVFTMALALQLLLLARLGGRRPAVPIRRDLVGWLRNQAALGGESMEAVADRAISAYRAGFTDFDEPTDARIPATATETESPAPTDERAGDP
jgi:hypothetical protein